MRYANLIPHTHIARSPDARLTADTRRAFITSRAAVVAATESAKRFARTEALVRRDGTFDRSAIMRAARRTTACTPCSRPRARPALGCSA